MDIRKYLDDLENRIDAEVEEQLIADWRQFCRGQWQEDLFAPRRKRAVAPGIEWPSLPVSQTLADFDAMVLSQFAACAALIGTEKGGLLNVRSNYGVPILAVPFGSELFVMADELNCLPNCHPIGPQATRAWLEKGLPSLDHPYLEKVFEAGRRFMEIKRQYPKIGKYVFLYHPDLQGPMDILELIWGSEIFTAFIDEPETIHALLQLLTDFYIAVMEKWNSIVPQYDPEVSCHWNLMIPGQVMVRDDSAMNLPPQYFDEFIRPYDSQILGRLGGGCIHSCGRVDHWVPQLCQVTGIKGLNMSQPHLNKMDEVLAETIEKGIPLIGFEGKVAKELQAGGRRLRGRVASLG